MNVLRKWFWWFEIKALERLLDDQTNLLRDVTDEDTLINGYLSLGITRTELKTANEKYAALNAA